MTGDLTVNGVIKESTGSFKVLLWMSFFARRVLGMFTCAPMATAVLPGNLR